MSIVVLIAACLFIENIVPTYVHLSPSVFSNYQSHNLITLPPHPSSSEVIYKKTWQMKCWIPQNWCQACWGFLVPRHAGTVTELPSETSDTLLQLLIPRKGFSSSKHSTFYTVISFWRWMWTEHSYLTEYVHLIQLEHGLPGLHICYLVPARKNIFKVLKIYIHVLSHQSFKITCRQKMVQCGVYFAEHVFSGFVH